MRKLLLFLMIISLVVAMYACVSDKPSVTPNPVDGTEQPTASVQADDRQTSAEPNATETTSAEPEEYMFDELNFGLKFPSSWYGRYELKQDGDVLTVCIDGIAFCAYTVLENAPGIWENEALLLEDGYMYLCQTESNFYYYKVFGKTPDELSMHFTGYGGGGYIAEEAYDARSLFFIRSDTCNFDGSILVDNRLIPTQSQYMDYRLGICISLPEEWLGKCLLACNDYSVHIYDNSDGETAALSFYVPNEHSRECAGTTAYTYLCTGDGRTYYARVYEYDSVSGRDYSELAENADALRAMLPDLYHILEPVEMLDENPDHSAIEASVLEFLDAYVRSTFLYEDIDLSGYTTASMSEADRASIALACDTFPYHLLLTKQYADINPCFADQSEYILEKTEYIRDYRLQEKVLHKDLETEYYINCIHFADDYAQVWAAVGKSFYYEGMSEASYMGDEYEIYLIKVNGQWLIFDMFSTEGFDNISKEVRP